MDTFIIEDLYDGEEEYYDTDTDTEIEIN